MPFSLKYLNQTKLEKLHRAKRIEEPLRSQAGICEVDRQLENCHFPLVIQVSIRVLPSSSHHTGFPKFLQYVWLRVSFSYHEVPATLETIFFHHRLTSVPPGAMVCPLSLSSHAIQVFLRVFGRIAGQPLFQEVVSGLEMVAIISNDMPYHLHHPSQAPSQDNSILYWWMLMKVHFDLSA